eukprot:TRINITY_DN12861_c0_g1_i4.p1 TRINITY_DN12861_c0_g1~~TRINITY_DN12861_c0_g1_i4.p1  ORF type:complete len:161 (-),score=30.21 TRINITY_DN12861_c0_g1_i4:15-497(-)
MVPTARSNTHDRGVGAVIGAGSEAVVPVRNSRVSSRAPSANAKVPRPTTTTTGARATTTANAGGNLPRSSSSSTTAVGNHNNVAVLSRPTASTKARKAVTSSSSLSLIHISEPTRLLSISYAVFCLKKKKKNDILPSPKHPIKVHTTKQHLAKDNSGTST